jgi:hypothetical protein
MLFDRVTFPGPAGIKGYRRRALFARPDKYPVAWQPWEDEELLWDVDTEVMRNTYMNSISGLQPFKIN